MMKIKEYLPVKTKVTLKKSFVSKNPQEFDPKIGAYLEGYDKFKSTKLNRSRIVRTKVRLQIILRQYQLQSNVDRQNISAPAVIEPQRGLDADADRNPANGELRQGFGIENFNTTRNSLKIGRVGTCYSNSKEEYFK